MRRFLRYLLNILVSLDQFANVLLGGYPDETISSRAAKGALAGDTKWCLLCRLLDVFDRGHCERYIELDEGKPPRRRSGKS